MGEAWWLDHTGKSWDVGDDSVHREAIARIAQEYPGLDVSHTIPPGWMQIRKFASNVFVSVMKSTEDLFQRAQKFLLRSAEHVKDVGWYDDTAKQTVFFPFDLFLKAPTLMAAIARLKYIPREAGRRRRRAAAGVMGPAWLVDAQGRSHNFNMAHGDYARENGLREADYMAVRVYPEGWTVVVPAWNESWLTVAQDFLREQHVDPAAEVTVSAAKSWARWFKLPVGELLDATGWGELHRRIETLTGGY